MTDTVEDNESNSPCCRTLLDRNCRCWRRQLTHHLEEQLDSTATSGQGASFGNFLGLLETGLNPTGETVPSLIPRALYLLPVVAVFGSVSVLQTFLLTGALLLLPNLIQANKHFLEFIMSLLIVLVPTLLPAWSTCQTAVVTFEEHTGHLLKIPLKPRKLFPSPFRFSHDAMSP